MSNNIMNPQHPDWNEFVFCIRLPHLSDRINVGNKFIVLCDGNPRFTRMVLEAFPDVDVEKTLEFFREHGGHDDCEIINIVIPELEGEPKPLNREEELRHDLIHILDQIFTHFGKKGHSGERIIRGVLAVVEDIAEVFGEVVDEIQRKTKLRVIEGGAK